MYLKYISPRAEMFETDYEGVLMSSNPEGDLGFLEENTIIND